jgi:hypothetical protein
MGQTAVLTGVSRAVVLAGTLALIGCTTLSKAYHAVADPVENAFTEPKRMTYAKSSPPPPPALHSASTTETRSPPAAEPTPVVINGLSGTAVRAMLGQPTTRSGPAPGETWTYRSGSCEVELFLFPDVTHGGLHVLDYRVSGAGSHADGQQGCLQRLRNAQS